jgi:hypothetical protein
MSNNEEQISNRQFKHQNSNADKLSNYSHEQHHNILISVENTKAERSKMRLKINPANMKLRIILSLLFVTAYFIVASDTYSNKIKEFLDISQISKFTNNLTEQLEDYLRRHIAVRNSLFIFSSISVDFLALFSFIMFALYSKNFRFLLTNLIYAILLLIFQNIFYFVDSPSSLWTYPGFPSLVNSYSKTTSYYYYGAVGFSIICALEFYKYKFKVMMWFALFSVLLQASVLVGVRGHYLIDVITGVIIAHYCFMISELIIDEVEVKMYENIEPEHLI